MVAVGCWVHLGGGQVYLMAVVWLLLGGRACLPEWMWVNGCIWVGEAKLFGGNRVVSVTVCDFAFIYVVWCIERVGDRFEICMLCGCIERVGYRPFDFAMIYRCCVV